MTVNATEYLKTQYLTTRAMGDKAVASDATFVIAGQEPLHLLTKQFPYPEITVGGEIEVPTPMGAASWQPQQLKVHQQGQLAFMETVSGHIAKFMEQVVQGPGFGRFDAIVYEGTPDRFSRGYKLRDCFWVADNPDRDWENRSQILMITGTLFFHFFGEKIAGNVPAL